MTGPSGMSWVVDAYPLPYAPLAPELPWAAATVERWTDRVVVQIVAPQTETRLASQAALAYECGWAVRFRSGRSSLLAAGRGDEGEGTLRCYLLFYANADDEPVELTGRIGGVPATAVLAPSPVAG